MVVLSLFDGISCGQVALERAGIKVSKYYASEIDENAIKVTQHNYPNTIQLGDITKWKEWDIEQPDLIMGGSPCQDLSFMKTTAIGKKEERENLGGEQSKLFFVFANIVKSFSPKCFLLENVVMDNESQSVISDYMGIEPIKINSSLFSAQSRERLYWSNISFDELPESNDSVLKDILEPSETVTEKEGKMKFWYGEERPYKIVNNGRVYAEFTGSGFTRSSREIQSPNYKSCTLLVDGGGGNRQKKVFQDGRPRKLTPLEYERLQTLPDDYTSVISNTQRYNTVGNGWTVDVVAHILKGIKE